MVAKYSPKRWNPTSGKKVVGFMKEDKTELVPMVKKIKNIVPNTKFSHVVYTSVAASLNDYFRRNPCKIPDKMTIGFTFIKSFRNLGQPGPAVLANDLTVGLLEIPCFKERHLLDMLEKLGDQYEFASSAPDGEVNYLTLNYFLGPFPLNIIGRFFVLDDVTSFITNLPGGPKITVLDGCELTHLLPVLPNRGKCGIVFGIVTYDDRFQVGVFADKVLVTSEEVQKIANGFEENIRLLAKEVKTKYE